MKILILYYEIAHYNIPCFKELSKSNQVFLVKYDLNTNEAPFEFNFDFPINIYNELSYDNLSSLSDEIDPDIIFCAGWKNSDYLKLCLNNNNKIIILGFDTPWSGSLKQWLGVLFYRFKYDKVFNYAFIPGEAQYKLANMMGFNQLQIKLGAYSCDFSYFNEVGNKFKSEKKENFPKRFLFVGRYVKRKGILELWESFIQLQSESPNDWELWCVGIGPLFDIRPIHPKIKHFGFLQFSEMNFLIRETSVFILPSHFEPWGVVVHEFASAGLPLILSDKISSSSIFLDQGINGFSFKSKSVKSLKSAISKIMEINNDNLLKMGEISTKLASKITPKKWVKTLLND